MADGKNPKKKKKPEVGESISTARESTPPPTRKKPVPSSARYVYGFLDLFFASLYLFLFLKVVPSRSLPFSVMAVAVSLLLGAGGVGMFLWSPWGLRLARAASWLLLIVGALLIAGLVTSAAYLHGIYDGVGQAGVAISLVVMALIVELVGILPILQILYLRREAAR
ncbi:MAG: hypothetical protein KAI47_00060 [Deltaproteobacteria bacterium]|nr:hypothetical protein [Deltaproteobacteria bacterium]